MSRSPCLCTGRTDVVCNERECSIAGPGAPGNANECRVCWLRFERATKAPPRGRCKHLGDDTGERMLCPTCNGKVELKVLACSVHSRCTLTKRVPGVACCDSQCKEYSPLRPPNKWVVAVTSVTERSELLRATLASLNVAGFSSPQVYMDTEPRLGIAARWLTALADMYLRNPFADRYAVFQDDVEAVGSLRYYLDACKLPPRCYWNLYTANENDGPQRGWQLSNQLGKGALALVFSREGAYEVLSAKHMWARFQDNDPRSRRNVDGAVMQSMLAIGWKELVHRPSLVQHTSDASTTNAKDPRYWRANSFVQGNALEMYSAR